MEIQTVEKNWYKEVKNFDSKCPCCGHNGPLHVFITEGDWPLTYEEFCLGKCPKCENIIIFDYKNKCLTKEGEGRKPFPILIGMGRIFDYIVAALGIYFLIKGDLLWLPIIYILLILIELTWELILKKENPWWYCSDSTFHFVTDRLAYIGIPFTIMQVLLLIIAIYILW